MIYSFKHNVQRTATYTLYLLIIGLIAAFIFATYRMGYAAIYRKYRLVEIACSKGGGTVMTEKKQLRSNTIPDVEFYCVLK
jgi:hypothetical protein